MEERASRLMAGLAGEGYEVKSGYFRLYTEEDCAYSYDVMKSCYGNNPAAPYVLFAAPAWPDEFVDPATQMAFGPTLAGYNATFRLDPREAIVIFGHLPPQAAYFGLQTYLFTREGTYDETSATYNFVKTHFPDMLGFLFGTVPQNAKRIQVLASLGNSINNVVIEGQSGAAFGQDRVLVITADQFMDGAVRQALATLSVPEANIYTEPIPSTMVVGLDEAADEFLTVIRYAEPGDGGAPGTPSDLWRNELPLTVLRVRDTRPDRPPQPYGPPALEARMAEDESGLKDDLLKLVSELNRRWGQRCTQAGCSDRAASFIDLQAQPINLVGPVCTTIGMNCLGDTQDTTYQTTTNLPLGSRDVYAVVGTLGTRTGNATYVGLSVNDSLLLKGVTNISSEQLKDSALDYAGVLGDASLFYAYYFARDCSGLEALTGGHCYSISETELPPCAQPGDPTCHNLKLIQREYIHPGTQRGPAATLLPRLIRLEKPRLYLPLLVRNR